MQCPSFFPVRLAASQPGGFSHFLACTEEVGLKHADRSSTAASGIFGKGTWCEVGNTFRDVCTPSGKLAPHKSCALTNPELDQKQPKNPQGSKGSSKETAERRPKQGGNSCVFKALHMLSKPTLPTEPRSCSRRVCLAMSSHFSHFLCLSHVMFLAISLLSGPVLHAVSVRKLHKVDLGRRVLIIHLFFRFLQKRQKPLL